MLNYGACWYLCCSRHLTWLSLSYNFKPASLARGPSISSVSTVFALLLVVIMGPGLWSLQGLSNQSLWYMLIKIPSTRVQVGGGGGWTQRSTTSFPEPLYLCCLSSIFQFLGAPILFHLAQNAIHFCDWNKSSFQVVVGQRELKHIFCPSLHEATAPPNGEESSSPSYIWLLQFSLAATIATAAGKGEKEKPLRAFSDFVWALGVLFIATQARARELLEFFLICATVISSRFQADLSPVCMMLEGKNYRFTGTLNSGVLSWSTCWYLLFRVFG